jgi:hypothetical protein
VQIHSNEGTIHLIRMTIGTEQDAAVLRDAESARVLCAATCLVIEFNDGASGTGRAAFQKLLEEDCVSSTSGELEQSLANMHATELVAHVGNFKAACKRRTGVIGATRDNVLGQSGGHVETYPVLTPPVLEAEMGRTESVLHGSQQQFSSKDAPYRTEVVFGMH